MNNNYAEKELYDIEPYDEDVRHKNEEDFNYD